MNAADAAHLVERIVQTWPSGPRGRIWTEAFADLDAGTAGSAYVRMRNDHDSDRPPSIGQFMAMYRSLKTKHNTDADPEHCPSCGRDGAVTYWVERNGHHVRYSAARCQHGNNPYARLGQPLPGAVYEPPEPGLDP